MNPWRRQDALAHTTLRWAVLSVVGGLLALRGRDRWWRAFGWQHVGWGAANIVIVAVLRAVQRRRMGRLPDPYATGVLAAERRQLMIILLVNTVADLGYCAIGLVLGRGSRAPRLRGSGLAILIQGGFLAVHDGSHLLASLRDPLRASAAPAPATRRGC